MPTLHALILCLSSWHSPFFQEAVAQDIQPPQLVVRDVVFTPPSAQRENAWNKAAWIGDPERNGMASFFAVEARSFPGPPLVDWIPWVSSGASGEVLFGPDSDPWSRLDTGSGWEANSVAILRKPSGFTLVGKDRTDFRSLGSWDVETKEFQYSILPPPPPRGFPKTEYFNSVSWAGDQNQDGWDDLFYQSLAGNSPRYGTTGLIDGRSGQTLWQHYLPNFSLFSPVQCGLPSGWPDLNQDGISDYLSAFQTRDQSGNLRHSISALSGADGSVLWTNDRRSSDWLQQSACGPDLNADGVSDTITATHPVPGTADLGFVAAISGTDGSSLWEVSGDVLKDSIPFDSVYLFRHPIFFCRQLGSPENSLVLLTIEIWHTSQPTEDVFVMLDGKTGTNLGIVGLPENLLPWLPDAVDNPIPFQDHWLLGDIDGDGCQEVARRLALPAYDTPLTTLVPGCFAILGMRTLFIPELGAVGSIIEATVSIPAGVDKPFRLLLSTGFRKRNASPKVQGWATLLATTPLLRATAVDPRAHGRLDANGEATLSFRLPSAASLIGRTIYSRAVVEDPARPGEILTMSSLGVTTITP